MKTKISVVANMFIKQMEFEGVGDRWIGDRHTFDHQTILAHGSVKAWTENQTPLTYQAPHILVIKKGVTHNFESVAAETCMYCVHPLRKSDAIDDIYDEGDRPHMDDVSPLVES